MIEPETKDGLGRILCLAVESGPIEPTKQFIKSLVHVMDTTGLLEILKNTQRPWWNRPILDNHIHITSYITQVIRVLQGKRDVDKLVLICQNVCPNSKVHDNEVNDVMSTMVSMVLIMIDDVDQTAATVTSLLRAVGDISGYKSNITLTIELTGWWIVSRPLLDRHWSGIELGPEVVDTLLPGLLMSAVNMLPLQVRRGHQKRRPWPWRSLSHYDNSTILHARRQIASAITPVPGLFEDPATIDLPRLLSSHTKTEVVEVSEVSDELPAKCREVGNVLGCLLLQSGEDPTSYRFEPFDLSHWPVAVKFADEWVHEKPAAWWQRIVPSVRKVWVLTKSSPECRQGEGIDQIYGTCWMVSVLNLFARVPFMFLMLHKDLQKVVLACDGMHSDGENILRKSASTRQQQECPKLPRPFHDYMEEEHETWYDVTLDSGWFPRVLIQGMFKFSGNKYDEQNKTITSLLTTIEYKEVVVGVEEEQEEEAEEATGWEPQDGFSAWLTAQCSGYEAGLFSFRKKHEDGHVVALTMCQGEVIVCDYGACVSITDWVQKEGLTVVLRANLTLFRQALPLRSHNPSASSWREYLALYHRQLLRWRRT